MADFTICAPEPFVITSKVSGKTYEIPRGVDMSAEQIVEVGRIAKTKDDIEKVKRAKDFLLGLCPELAEEPISDVGYMALFSAVCESGMASMGES